QGDAATGSLFDDVDAKNAGVDRAGGLCAKGGVCPSRGYEADDGCSPRQRRYAISHLEWSSFRISPRTTDLVFVAVLGSSLGSTMGRRTDSRLRSRPAPLKRRRSR